MEKTNNYLKIKSHFKYFLFLILYYFCFPFSKLFYGRKNNWLVCERGNDAQDNGFAFFKFIVEKHPEVRPVYLIKKTSPDFKKVKKIGRAVEYGSIKHFLMVIGYPVKISSHLLGYAPWVSMATYFRRNKTKDKHIFLQHGITKNFHEGLCFENCKFLNLFICGAKPEYEYIKTEFHYNNNIPQYAGLARYDYLLNYECKNQVLLMPTWRSKLLNLSCDEFVNTTYFKEWNRLINSKSLLEICRKNSISIKFYLHYSLQKYSHLFKSNDIVQIIKFGEYGVQDLLKESKLLITDFSSVFFDFAYMRKPVIYYQFDEQTFYDEHYEKGYFDYRKDGFGDVVLTTQDVIESFKKLVINNFNLEKKYLHKTDIFFVYNDNKNRERIFNAINGLNYEK